MTLNDVLAGKIAKLEGVSREKIIKGLDSGEIVIPYNKVHSPLHLMAVGTGLRTKVNANIGTSKEFSDLSVELEKVDACVKNKADAIMDLSVGGELDEIRQAIINASTLPVGTVPIYQAVIEAGSIEKMTAEIM